MKSQRQHLVLVRHGQSEANLHLLELTDDALYYSTSGSDPQVGLTDQGLKEGCAAGMLLAQRFPPESPIDVIFHTEFRRVSDTVTQIESKLPYRPQRISDVRLNKRSYGNFWNLTRKGVQELFPDQYARYLSEGDLLFRAPGGGENYPDVFDRVNDFIEERLHNTNGNVVVVTHSVVVLSFRRKLEGLSDQDVLDQYESMALANGHLIVYERDNPSLDWTLAQAG